MRLKYGTKLNTEKLKMLFNTLHICLKINSEFKHWLNGKTVRIGLSCWLTVQYRKLRILPFPFICCTLNINNNH